MASPFSELNIPIEALLDWALNGQLTRVHDINKGEVTNTVNFDKLLNYLGNRFGDGPEQMLRLVKEAEQRKAKRCK